MKNYDDTMTIPAEDFFIPLELLDDEVATHPHFEPPALKVCDFEVVKKPLFHQDRSPQANFRGAVRPIDPKIGGLLTRKDNDAALSIVGSEYHTVQNHDAYEAMWDVLTPLLPPSALRGVQVTEYSEREGAFNRIDVDFPHHCITLEPKNGSMTLLSLGVTALIPHGDSSPRFLAYAKDAMCDNIIPLGEYAAPNTRRTANYTFTALQETLRKDVTGFRKDVEVMRQWAETPMTALEFEGLLNSHGFSATDRSKLSEHFETESSKRGETVWCGVATLTAWATHDDLFYVKGSASTGEAASGLTQRLFKVSQIIHSPSFKGVLS